MRFSSIPHLQAPHWMISSVVPVKFPVTLLRLAMKALQYVHEELLFHGTAPLGTVWFATLFSGRGSHGLRVTRLAQSASARGPAAPPASVPKSSPAAGTRAVAPDDADAWPAVFAAVTSTRSVRLRSAEATTYDVPVAPEMSAQEAPAESQRRH